MTTEAVTAITNGVDFATIVVGIGTVAAAVIGIYVAIKGVRMLYAAVR